MRRPVALSIAAGACALALACANASFVLDTTPTDGSVDTSNDAALDGASVDAAVLDARDDPRASDGAQADSPSARDAFSLPDVQDERFPDVADEPGSCGGQFGCAPDVPSGWTGPLELYAGMGPPPACGSSFAGVTIDGNAGLAAPPPTCNCNCDLPQGVHCSVPAMTFYASQSACSAATSCATASPLPSACTPTDVTSQCLFGVAGAVFSAPPSTPSQGSCLAVSAVSVPPSVMWARTARGCGASAAPPRNDCPAGNACVPTPTAPFKASLCIEQPGDVACPATGYTVKDLFHGAVDDTRACSPCSCGPVTGASCAGTISQFASGNGCTSAQTTYKLPLSCAPIQQPAEVQLSLTASGGACKASPTGPIGMATPAKPMTFCCTP